jgi:hypothetical protein
MKWHAWSKWPLLGVAVTAVVMAAPPSDDQDGVEVTATGKSQQPAQVLHRAVTQENQTGQQVNRVELELLKRVKPEAAATEKTDVTVANVFNPVSWYEPPPPPPPPVPVPEPAPTAPPIPFSYLGRYEDPPKNIVMLTRNEQIYTVSVGDVIDETYRVKQIGNGSVTLVYLPLGTIQSISMGAK